VHRRQWLFSVLFEDGMADFCKQILVVKEGCVCLARFFARFPFRNATRRSGIVDFCQAFFAKNGENASSNISGDVVPFAATLRAYLKLIRFYKNCLKYFAEKTFDVPLAAAFPQTGKAMCSHRYFG